MLTRPALSFFLSILLISVAVRAATGQQPTDPKPATPPAAASGNSSSTAIAPKPADLSPFELAMALYRAGKYTEAAAAFDQLGQSGGADSAKAYAWLARADLKLEKIDAAEAAAQKALALSPNLSTGHSALGEVYFRQGKFPDAEKEFLTPLKAGIPDAHSYLGEARISASTSNLKHAKQLFDKAHALDPQDPDILIWWIRTVPRAPRVVAATKDPAPADPAAASSNKSEAVAVDPEGNTPVEQNCRLVTPVTSTEAPLETMAVGAQQLRGFGLTVKVNGTPSRLLLDTGASGILINSKLAEHAGVRRGAETKVAGFGDQGAAVGYVGYADSIQVGGLEFKGCFIRVVDRKRSLNEDGLIGPDVFQDFLIDLNFPDRKFALSELPKQPGAAEQTLSLQSDENQPPELHDRYIAPDMDSYERFYRFGHYILVPTLVNTTTNSRLFLMDSGAQSTILAKDFAGQITKVHHDEDTTVHGISGSVKNVYRADSVKLGFPQSRLMQQPEDVVVLDISTMSDSAGTDISGVLGFSLLWLLDVKIDYRDGLVHFSYDPHRIR